jgi:hypothetical protein
LAYNCFIIDSFDNQMKEEMERIWRDYGCFSGCHLLKWNIEQIGYGTKGSILSWTKGRLTFPIWKRKKGIENEKVN